MEKLTQKQVIAALRRLNKGWPDDLQLLAMDGTLFLYPADAEPSRRDAFSSDEAIDVFPAIKADGGGW